MPPKAKDKNVTSNEPRKGEESRSIVVTVEGLLAAELEEPYLSVQLPTEDEPRVSCKLFEARCFDGDYTDQNGTPITILTSSKEGGPAIKASHSVTKAEIWKAASLPEIGGDASNEIEGQLKAVVDKNRSHWLPCKIKAKSTCEIVVSIDDNDTVYSRIGKHAFCFRTQLLNLELNPVSTEAITSKLSSQIFLNVMSKKPLTQDEQGTEPESGKPKAKGKDDKAKNQSKDDKAFTIHAKTIISFIPLVMGAVRSEILCEDVSTSKARHPLDGFLKFKVIMRSFDQEGVPRKLLSEYQERTLMPMSITVKSVEEVPDTRPVSISTSEFGRPNVDLMSTERPDYSVQKATSSGVRVVCQVLPGAPEFKTLSVPHERNVGIHQHQLLLLGEIADITGGSIPTQLDLLKYLFENDIIIKVYDRELKCDVDDAASGQFGFGVARFGLSQLLREKSAQPTLKISEQVKSYRPSISECDSDMSAAARQLPQGHYMSWGTTVVVTIALCTKSPQISFRHSSLVKYCAGATAAASVCLSVIFSVFIDADIQLPGSVMGTPREISTPLEPVGSTVPFEIATPVFSRLVLILDYKRESNQHILQSIMNSVVSAQRTARGHEGDVVPFEYPAMDEKIESDPNLDPKKKAAAGGRPPSQPQQSTTLEEEEETVSDGVIEVQTTDTISGFEVIDGVVRIIVIEGLTTTVLSKVMNAIHETTTGDEVMTDAIRVIYNPKMAFPNRSYHTWPPLVSHVEKSQEDDSAADAGGVGNRIRRIRLSKTLTELSSTFSNYVKRSVSDGVLRAVKTLSILSTLTNMADALSFNAFPAARDIIQLERMYGTTLSAYDVCGRVTFCPFGSEQVVEAVPKEEVDGQEEQLSATEAVVDLWQNLDKDVIVVGKPARSDVMFGRRTSTHQRCVDLPEPYSQLKQQLLFVPATGDHLLMLLSGMPSLQKNITHQVSGRLIGFQDSGTLCILVYRWKEFVQGRLGSTIKNTEFMAKKTKDKQTLSYKHYAGIERAKKKHRQLEEQKKNNTLMKEEQGYSSGSDVSEYDYSMGLRQSDELYLPPQFAKVQRNYRYHNKTAIRDIDPLSKRRHKQPTYHNSDDNRPITPKPTTDKHPESKTAFKQLGGGWTPVLPEHLQSGLRVKMNATNVKGTLLSWNGTCLTIKPDGSEDTLIVNISDVKVDAKCARLDNIHPLKPAACRIEDLKQPWQPHKNPFERKTGGKDMTITRPNDLIGKKVVSVFAQDGGDGLEKEQAARVAAERELWKSKLVVSDPVFRVAIPQNHIIDRTKGLLMGDAQKKALTKNALDHPPLSIHAPDTDIKKENYKVSTVYYAGNSHKWSGLDNFTQKRIKPLSESEKKGPVW